MPRSRRQSSDPHVPLRHCGHRISHFSGGHGPCVGCGTGCGGICICFVRLAWPWRFSVSDRADGCCFEEGLLTSTIYLTKAIDDGDNNPDNDNGASQRLAELAEANKTNIEINANLFLLVTLSLKTDDPIDQLSIVESKRISEHFNPVHSSNILLSLVIVVFVSISKGTLKLKELLVNDLVDNNKYMFIFKLSHTISTISWWVWHISPIKLHTFI